MSAMKVPQVLPRVAARKWKKALPTVVPFAGAGYGEYLAGHVFMLGGCFGFQAQVFVGGMEGVLMGDCHAALRNALSDLHFIPLQVDRRFIFGKLHGYRRVANFSIHPSGAVAMR
jgi:hypothetical protein